MGKRKQNLSEKQIESGIVLELSNLLNLKRQDLDVDRPFKELGLNFKLYKELIKSLNTALGAQLNTLIFYNYPTVRDLARYLFERPKVARNRIVPKRAARYEKQGSRSHNGSGLRGQGQNVAIIGMTCRLPGARNAGEFWENLKAGVNSIERISEDRWQDLNWYNPDPRHEGTSYGQWGGILEDSDKFDPLFFGISPSEAEIMDPQQRVFLEESWKAFEDAGYKASNLSRTKVGVFVGAGTGDYLPLLHQFGADRSGSAFTGSSQAILAARISYFMNLTGPSLSIDTACSSSLVAIDRAYQSILSGECEMALAGGVYLMNTPRDQIWSSQLGMLSREGKCKTFDDTADGIVVSEGVGLIVIKRQESAERDGDRIYAIIKGSGINQDGRTNGITAPSARAQQDLELSIYKKYNIDPSTIRYVETHGTGTKLGDPIEVNSLTAAFRKYTNRNKYCAIGSVKTNIGHTAFSSGVAGLIKTVLMLSNKQYVPSLHFSKANSEIDFEHSPFYVNVELKEWRTENNRPRLAAINSFGFSGTNAHLILQEYQSKPRQLPKKRSPAIIVLSAKSKDRLKEQVENLMKYLKRKPETDLVDIAYTLQLCRESMEERLAFVVNDRSDLLENLNNYIEEKWTGLFVGNGRNDVSDHLIEPDDGKELIEKLIRDKNKKRLAQLWVSGEAIDWRLLYTGQGPAKIGLPTYPFARKRFWIKSNRVREATPQFGLLHPLLHANESDVTDLKFMSTFTGAETFFVDHVVRGEKVFPGVGFLELAREAGERAVQKKITKIKSVVWLRPMSPKEGVAKVGINLIKENHDLRYTVYSGHGEDRIIYGQGRLLTEELDPSPALDIKRIRDGCQKEVSGKKLYEDFKETGLDLGTSYRGVERIFIGENEALSRITLNPVPGYRYSPGILDSTLHTIYGLLTRNGEKYSLALPYKLGEVHFCRALDGVSFLWGYARVRSSENDDLTHFDISLLDEAGNCLVNFLDFLALPIGNVGKEPEKPTAHLFVSEWKHSKPKLVQAPAGQLVLLAGGSANLADRLKESLELEVRAVATHDERSFFEFLLERIREMSITHLPGNIIVVCSNNDFLDYGFVSGLFRTAHLEHSNVRGKVIGVESILETDADQIKRTLENELTNYDVEVCYRDGIRLTKEIDELAFPTEGELLSRPVIKEGGVYLITGGLGGLGKIFANYIANTRNTKLVVSGRTKHSVEQQSSGTGGQIEYYRCDVCNKDEIIALIKTIKSVHQRLDGIIHCAGVIHDSFIARKTAQEIQDVLDPKIAGVKNLDEATKDETLDFVVLFSSIASLFGNIGQADYAAANSYLDNYSKYRNDLKSRGLRHGHTVSISWCLWDEGGMRLHPENQRFFEKHFGMKPMPTPNGIRAFEAVLSKQADHVVVAYGQGSWIRKRFGQQPDSTRAKDDTQTKHLQGIVEDKVLELACSILKMGVSDMDVNQPFGAYGFDSISLTRFANDLNDHYDLDLIPTIFFNYQTVESLSGFLVEQYPDKLLDRHRNTPGELLTPDDRTTPATTPSRSTEDEGYLVPLNAPSSKSSSTNLPTEDPVAIVGISGRFPGSPNLEVFWDNLENNRDLITEVPGERWDWRALYGDPLNEDNKTYSKWGGFIEDADKFDPLFFNLSPKEAELMDPQQRIVLESVYHGLEDAGISLEKIRGTNTSVFIGVSGFDYSILLEKNGKAGQAHFSTGSVHSVLVNRVSYFLDIHGPSEPVDTACSSSLIAINRAAESIKSGNCNMAIAGGVNLLLTPEMTLSFSHAGMLSADGRCKPFDESANGYVRGEGVGVVVLKTLSRAEADCDHIYGVIRATSENHGGKANTLTSPNSDAQKELLLHAYRSANVDPRRVSYIEAHGTGTSLGDPIEVDALKNAFKELYKDFGLPDTTIPYCGIGSVKANIGHLEAAAGIASVLKVLLSLKHGVIPGNPHLRSANKYVNLNGSPFYLQEGTTQAVSIMNQPRLAGVSSFGFGGANAHIVIEEYQDNRNVKYVSSSSAIIVLSAKSEEKLREKASDLKAYLGSHPEVNLHDLAYTLQIGRDAMEERLAVVAGHCREVIIELSDYLQARPRKYLSGNSKKSKVTLRSNAPGKESVEKAISSNDLTLLVELWVKGESIPWERLYLVKKPHKLSLPTYPFARERYWFDSYPGKSAGSKMKAVEKPPKTTGSLWDSKQIQLSRNHTIGQELQVDMLEGGVALVQMKAKESRNMFTEQLILGLQKTFLELRENDLVKTVVLTGYDNVFCMGGSEKGLKDLATRRQVFTDFPFLYRGLLEFNLPVISAIQGHAFGGGFLFGLYADIVLLSEESTYTANFMEYGFAPGMGATFILGEKLGKQLATEMMYTARLLSGEEIRRRGASVLVVKDVLKEAMRLARELSSKPRKALELLKENLSEDLLNEVQQHVEKEAQMHEKTLSNPDVERRIVDQFEKTSTRTITYGKGTVRKLPTRAAKVSLVGANEPGTETDMVTTRKVSLVQTSETIAQNAFNQVQQLELLSATASPESTVPWKMRLKEILENMIHVPVEKIDDDANFVDLGVDSISGVQIIRNVNNDFGIGLEAIMLYDYNTVNKLHSLILRESHVASQLAGATQEGSSVKSKELEFEEATGSASVLSASLEKTPSATESGLVNTNDLEIAVIGISGQFPGASDVHEFWEALSAGKDCISEVPPRKWIVEEKYSEDKEAPGKSYGKWMGSLNDEDKFDAMFFNISPREAQRMDPQQRLFLEQSWKAIEDAGYASSSLSGTKCGVFVGAAQGDYENHFRSEELDSHVFTGMSSSILAARVSYHMDLRGPAVSTDTSCSSSLVAIHQACQSLRTGESTMAIAGGVYVMTTAQMHVMTSKAGMLSEDGKCYAFDRRANGFVPGEAVAVVVLKALRKAEQDGDRIYAVIKGSGINQDGRTNGITAPSFESQVRLEREVYEQSHINPETITYVETHGTGTKLGDPIEIKALKDSFKIYTNKTNYCGIGSVKANIGHTLMAAGVSSVVKVLLSMVHKKLPPTINYETINEHIDLRDSPFYINNQLRDWVTDSGVPRRAAVSSFSFSGTNAHLVIEEYRQQANPSYDGGGPAIIVLSATDEARLYEQVENLKNHVTTNPNLGLYDIAYTLQVGRDEMEERLAIIANDKDDLVQQLSNNLEGKAESSLKGNIRIHSRDFLLNDAGGKNFYNYALENKEVISLAQLWVRGIAVDWNRLYPGSKPQKVSLPTYPFSKQRYWFDSHTQDEVLLNASPATRTPDYISEVGLKAFILAPDPNETDNASVVRVANHLLDIIRKTLYLGDKVDRDRKFVDLGMDSVTGVEFAKQISVQFGINLSATTLYDHPTIERLSSFVFKQISARTESQGDRDEKASKAGFQESTPPPIPVENRPHSDSFGYVVGRSQPVASTVLQNVGFADPTAREVQIKVIASGINFPDIMCVKGLYPTLPAYPFIPGFEVAGVVVKTGPGVSGISVGDEVMALTGKSLGGHASHVNVQEGTIIKKPAKLSFEEACSLPVIFLTAYYTLKEASAAAQQDVLVQTAAGGCGLMAIQLLNLIGGNAFGTSGSDQKLEFLKEIGVDHHYNYKKKDFEKAMMVMTQGRGFDVVINTLFAEMIQVGLNLLGRGGRYMELATHALKASSTLDLSGLTRNQSIRSIDLRQMMGNEERLNVREVFEVMVKMVESNLIFPVISRIYPFSRIHEAFSHVESGAHIGKIVLSHTATEMIDCTDQLKKNLKAQKQFALTHRIDLNSNQFLGSAQSRLYSAGNELSDIAVVGLSARLPQAATAGIFWENLKAGKNSIVEVPETRWKQNNYYDSNPKVKGKSYSKWMGLLDDSDQFDPLFFNISPREADRMDPQQRLILQETWKAMEDGGFNPDSMSDGKCGVFIGVAHGDYEQAQTQEPADLDAIALTGNSSSILSARISYLLNLSGPCMSIDTSCSSSLVAVAQACDSLCLGNCDVAVAGGVCLMTTPAMHIMASKAGMLSPDGRCHTFDQKANGFVASEAVCVLLLKKLDKAVEDGDLIYGVVKGWGINQDGATNGITAPSKDSQASLQKDVYRKFSIHPETVTYVETHGTGTKLGDPIEVNALKESFGAFTSKAHYCGLGSVKSNIGHALTAAGVSGLIKVLLCIKHRQLPPTINFEKINEHIDLKESPFYIIDRLTDWGASTGAPRRAAVNSFGFSGTNAHIVVEEYQPLARQTFTGQGPAIVVLSAKNKARLYDRVKNLSAFVENNQKANVYDVAYTLQIGREHMEERLGVLAKDLTELARRLDDYLINETNNLYLGSSKEEGWVFDIKERTDLPHTRELVATIEHESLIQQWVKGAVIDWKLLYPGKKPDKIALPTYPFAREQYWYGVHSGHSASGNPEETEVDPGAIMADVRTEQGRLTNKVQLEDLDLSFIHSKDGHEEELAPRNNESATSNARPTESVDVPTILTKLLADALYIEPGQIDNDEKFIDLGLDSILAVELVDRINIYFDTSLVASDLYNFPSITDLSKWIDSLLADRAANAATSVDSIKLPDLKKLSNLNEEDLNLTNRQGYASIEESEYDIAIIGFSGVFPGAENSDKFWEHLRSGKDLITEVSEERWDIKTYFDVDPEVRGKSYSKWLGAIDHYDKFDPIFFRISPKEADSMDPQQRLFLEQSWKAIEDAGYDPRGLSNRRCGVFVGVSQSDYVNSSIADSNLDAFTLTGNTSSILSSRISYLLNLRGPCISLDTACSSSLVAIAQGCDSLMNGDSDLVLAGGVYVMTNPRMHIMTSKAGMLSRDGKCYTFDRKADGFVLGEGAGIVIMKKLKDAKKDRDRICAVIKGWGVNQDGSTNGITAPSDQSQTLLQKGVYDKFGINPESISYVETHGTATKLGDPIEVKALTASFKAFTGKKNYCGLGSVKSNIGHALTAAGVFGLIKVLLSLKNQELPPTINFTELNEQIDLKESPFFINSSLKHWETEPGIMRRAAINSFGFSGTNVHMVIEEYICQGESYTSSLPAIIIVSARTEDSIKEQVTNLNHYLTLHPDANLFDVAYTMQTGRASMEVRLGVVAWNIEELKEKLDQYLLGEGAVTRGSVKEGKQQLKFVKGMLGDKLISQLIEAKSFDELLELWCAGAEVNWGLLYEAARPNRISLPTYPFERRRCWFDRKESTKVKPIGGNTNGHGGYRSLLKIRNIPNHP